MASAPDADAALIERLVRVDAVVTELARGGRRPLLAVGMVPLAEVASVRVGVFAEAGGVGGPAWEGFLPWTAPGELCGRHGALRRGAWDASLAQGWSVAWCEDCGGLSQEEAPRFVAWTPGGGRLRVEEGMVDVLVSGRWSVLPARRIEAVELVEVFGPEEDGERLALGELRLATGDRRRLGFPAGRLAAASALGQALAEALAVPWVLAG
ncbi:MAG: hypothetical protein H6742_18145 [Alphaproteobacteria bacterium]|nr:hypothetical protein [Alphaproteobacteria bacterium]